MPTTEVGLVHIAPTSLPSGMAGKTPCLYDESGSPTLQPTSKAVQDALTADSLVILDGLSDLLAMGFEPAEVFRTVRKTQSRVISVSN